MDVYTRNKLQGHCFDTEPIPEGWCATCVKGAAKGTPGYCGPGESRSMKEAPDITSNSTNWGFCNPHCAMGVEKLKTEMQVTDVDPRSTRKANSGLV